MCRERRSVLAEQQPFKLTDTEVRQVLSASCSSIWLSRMALRIKGTH
jgi:hypothetical protein